MPHITCLKCGSTEFDDGSHPFASLVGIGLIVVGGLLILCGSYCTVTDWATYTPCGDYAVPATIAITAGFFMLIAGRMRSDRVQCRRCGAVWTPPRPHHTASH